MAEDLMKSLQFKKKQLENEKLIGKKKRFFNNSSQGKEKCRQCKMNTT